MVYTKEYFKEYYQKNKKHIRQRNKIYYQKNKEYCKKWYQRTIEHARQQHNEYRQKNKEHYKEYRKKYYESKKMNPMYKINKAMSWNLWSSIRNKNNKHWETLVGYTISVLMKHLEQGFTPKMNWQNFGTYWHIDHIIPKSSFKFETTEDSEFKQCYALTNLRPLEKIKNLRKHAKILYML